jgi:hypothetical protein
MLQTASSVEIFGIRVADSNVMKSLGKSGDITKAQHCRAEVYIDSKGWFPVDPADVRKVVLETVAGIGLSFLWEIAKAELKMKLGLRWPAHHPQLAHFTDARHRRW